MKEAQFYPLTAHSDPRGYLMELFRLDIHSYQPLMAYLSWTKPDEIRGPHEHRQQSDFFVFAGPSNFRLDLWNPADNSHEARVVGETNPMAVLVPPGIVHAYKNIGKIDGLVINFPDKLYKGWNYESEIDEIRHEADENSPFRVN